MEEYKPENNIVVNANFSTTELRIVELKITVKSVTGYEVTGKLEITGGKGVYINGALSTSDINLSENTTNTIYIVEGTSYKLTGNSKGKLTGSTGLFS
jgi:hypothetical protein